MIPAKSAAADVLIVEDDPDLREALIDSLEEHGCPVAGVPSGKDAIRYLKTAERLPRLLLLDLHMANGDGFHFRQRQLEHADWASIPVLVVTGDSNILGNVDALRAAGYVRKPLDAGSLLQIVDRLLGAPRA